MYCPKTQTPNTQASFSRLPGNASSAPAGGNAISEVAQMTAAAGLWSSRRVRAAILTQQAARTQLR